MWSDLSALYRALRTTARPIRSHIIKVKGDCPAGSPRLEKHPGRIGDVSIEERLVEIRTGLGSCSLVEQERLWVYDLRALTETNVKHIIYFFAGGGFVQPAAVDQWKFFAHLASSLALAGVRVVLVSYPLAPNSPAKDSLPVLR
ncbi:hypothetical protein F5Y08DRAFT_306453 [Xylaria arbuscula]|nr:hypothetical protein F5Y08DRAFT_306453 [Xylaria arbuscula]